MPKRKATDEVDPTSTVKKKSKSERLAEARARAQQWAEDEKVKKETKTGPTAKKTPSKAKTTAAKTPAVKTPTAKKTPAKKELTPDKKQPTPSSRKSKAAKLAEARAHAKAWAAAEEAKGVTKNTGAKAAAKVAQPQIPPLPVIAPARRTRVKRATEAQPNPPYYGKVKANIGINHVPYDTKEVTVDTAMEGQPTPYKDSSAEINSNNATNSIPFDTKEVSPDVASAVGKPQSLLEKTGIMKKQSLQNKSDVVKTSSKLFENETASGTNNIEDDSAKEESSPAKRGRPYLTGIFIALGTAGLIFAISTGKLNFVKEMLPEEVTSFVDTLPKELAKKLPKNLNDFVPKSIVSEETRAPPCYVDDYEFNEEEEKIKPKAADVCDKTLPRIPCPEHGLCAEGALHICLDANYTPSVDGTACVWDEKAEKSFAQTEALLTNWTIQNYCKLSGAKFAHKSDTKAAVFPLSKVENETEVVQEMISESYNFVLVEINDEMMIGLSDTYVDTKLVLPTSCWITLAMLQTVSHFIGSALQALVSTAGLVLEFTYAYPIVALCTLLFIMVALYIRRRRKGQRELAKNIVIVRDMAFQRMSSDTSAHVVLHLRDAIAMEMHPMSRKGRSYIILKVWPRVVADIRQDNRVLKTNRQIGGKPRDVWQWAASTPAK
mmetsp:Transcript_15790/g.24243  ORF Transcript_15790/g.24243 Transcript_15790/m.24243 type:complete len:662 (+) Transcript_15790:118-2103(+)|eukprot:CAMPEP_0194222944 /NCGR_PEP_ID=MMETSP0156-20130528/34044_1 /TAXON_ID=33649 /ORGANISM="Thalassionema nitzschioides, Strain L26-B" /LENGTH=661 /DNA_ID=CAMNT_0038953917 /DNA_START=31 /DNA_END=2016 /DNA_ORIENTATION=-